MRPSAIRAARCITGSVWAPIQIGIEPRSGSGFRPAASMWWNSPSNVTTGLATAGA
jgi:hypothetical protein